MAPPVTFTRAGFWRGARRSFALIFGLAPFGLVCGMLAQAHGLSFAESTLMAITVYAGASQVLALSAWSHPASVVDATLAAFMVNSRMALMGPALGPWLDRLRGWKLWGTLALLVDNSFALSLTDMRQGGTDAGFLLGSSAALWVGWVAANVIGYATGAALHLPPGHPLFFAALATFLALLVSLWQGRGDLLPWAVGAAMALVLARLWPGTYWHIVIGALTGSLAGAVRDRLRAP